MNHQIPEPELGDPGFDRLKFDEPETGPDEPFEGAKAEATTFAPERITKRSITMSIAMVLTAVLIGASPLLPTTYVVRAPGPTFDTLGKVDDQTLIEVTGAQTFPTTGQLRLTTVSAFGTPEQGVPLGRVIWAWFSPDEAVFPIESVFTPGQSQEQINEVNQQAMVSSQETATVAALTEMGYVVPASMTIEGAVEDSDAESKVKVGDVIETFDGADVATYQQLVDELGKLTPGQEVKLGVKRSGERVDLEITTITGHDGTAFLGLFLATDFDFPVDVSLRIDNVGGSSAGMMFALGIIDLLTPADEAQGKIIAGTGTISIDGAVGPIGGIAYKMRGAMRDGADWFLAPAANCDEVVGNIPDGMHVFAVDTLAEARDAVVAIGTGQTAGLATCD